MREKISAGFRKISSLGEEPFIRKWKFKWFLVALLIPGFLGKLSAALHASLNSDNSLPGVIFFDLKNGHNYLLKGWFLAINSYLFTDFPVFFTLGSFMGMKPLTLKLGAFLLFLISLALLALLIRRTFGLEPALYSALFLFSASPFFTRFAIQAYIPRMGTLSFFLIGLILIGLLRKQPKTRLKNGLILSSIFLVNALASFSDTYFMLLVLSAVFACFLMILSKDNFLKRKMGVTLFLTAMGGVVAGTVLQHAVSSIGITIQPDVVPMRFIHPALLAESLIHFLRMTAALFNMNFLEDNLLWKEFSLRLINLVLFISVVISSFFIFKKEKDPDRRFVMLSLVSFWIIIGSAFIFKAGLESGLEYGRYLVPTVYAFSFLFALVLASDLAVMLRMLLILLFLASASANIQKNFQLDSNQKELGLVRFLEQNGLQYGFGDHWNANILTFLSQERLRVPSIRYRNSYLEPSWLNTKIDWYHPAFYSGPSFLIVAKSGQSYDFDRLYGSPELIVQAFGEPEKLLQYEDKYIYVWPFNIMQKLYSTQMETVPHEIGNFEQSPEGKIMHSAPGQRGFLVHGDVRTLRKGKYRATFEIRVNGPDTQVGAVVDISAINAASGKNPPTSFTRQVSNGPLWQKIVIYFDAEDLNYECRIFSTGAADVKVRSITMELLKEHS